MGKLKSERRSRVKTMSDTEVALLKAIRANPGDDAPRLVYADWLDEHGGPEERARAEFIRADCALAQLSPAAEDNPEWRQARDRVLALETAHKAAWAIPLGLTPDRVQYQRGFVRAVELTAALFLQK